jgi:hypothetical protein
VRRNEMVLDFLFAASVVAAGCALAGVRVERALAARQETVLQIGQVLRAPHGIEIDGRPFDPPASAPCEAIRYSRTDCPSCRADSTVWERFVNSLMERNCLVVGLSPTPSDAAASISGISGLHELAYVDLEWFHQGVRLGVEPTTILTGADSRVVWFRAGALSARDVQAALAHLPYRAEGKMR